MPKLPSFPTILCLMLMAMLVPSPGSAASDSAYLDELVAHARGAGLAKTRAWRNLVHYERGRFGRGWKSLVVSPEFFLAPQGRENPQQELEATLASFFIDQEETDQVQHPQCAFIARYQWLREQLDFDPARLTPQPCRRFEDWYATIDPAQVTMVFPAAYLNSPSSMFGHTLLRVDPHGEGTRLNSYAINYAAQTTETNGLAFAVLGLTGGYPGNFSIVPYYSKVKEYSAIENRDIWEYELNLNQAELRRLLEHAWELGPVHFDYYFFDDNCSYMLLALLDVARPGMNLTDDFDLYAIPSDTVRAVLAEEQMLSRVHYRPSNQTEIAHRAQFLDAREQELAMALANGTVAPGDPQVRELPGTQQGRVLDMASRYVQYRAGETSVELRRDRYIELLRARSRIPGGETTPPVEVPASRPDEGHGSGRLAVGGGRVAGQDFAELRFRPAYHDLMDPSAGYTPGAQINFLDTTVRYEADSDSWRLHRFDLVDVFSLTPRNRLFQPISWRAQAVLERLPLRGRADELVFVARGGGGVSYRVGDALVFGLLQGSIIIDDDLDRHHAFGAGPLGGLLWEITPSWKLWLSTRVEGYQGQADMTYREHKLEQSLTLARNLALRFSYTREGVAEAMRNTGQVGLQWYF